MDRVPSIPTPPEESSNDKDSPEKPNNKHKVSSKPPPTPLPLLRPDSMEGAVTLTDVFFSYPSRPNVPVLQNFSRSIPPNTAAALVGSSGGGKSTVVALLQRFYDVNSGSIQIDG